jgi:hypothetical protein
VDIPYTPEERAYYKQLKEWATYERQFARRVLDRVKAVKKEKRITTAALCAGLREAGWPTTVNSLNGMLSRKGRATITVTEVIAFGEALEVPPLDLIFGPADAAEPVWASFRFERAAHRARELFIGGSAAGLLEPLKEEFDRELQRVDETITRLQQMSEVLKARSSGSADRKFDGIPIDRLERENWTFNEEMPQAAFDRFSELVFAE